MGWFLLTTIIVVAAAVGIWWVGARARTGPPLTEQTMARLEREIAELQSRLSAEPDGSDPIAMEVWRARQAWWHAQLSNTPIQSLKVSGIGPGSCETLRRHGFNTLADLDRLRDTRIRSFGEAKRDALLGAYRQHRKRLEHLNQKLTWEELDALVGGTIARLRNDMSARSRAKLRADEARRIRLGELQRRHAAVSTLSRHSS